MHSFGLLSFITLTHPKPWALVVIYCSSPFNLPENSDTESVTFIKSLFHPFYIKHLRVFPTLLNGLHFLPPSHIWNSFKKLISVYRMPMDTVCMYLITIQRKI